MTRFLKSKRGEILLLAIISALIYLPLIGKIGYTHDDWYLMYAAKVKGASIFHTIFSVDRPLRAFVMIPAYTLFGENTLGYHLASYLFRLLSAFGFWWTLRLLWEKESNATFWMTLLFLIFPGFLSQANGIDYQSQMVALAAATFSLALSTKALIEEKRNKKALYLLGSALLAWLYLGLVEYFMGVEALRFLILFVIILRDDQQWKQKIYRVLFNSIYFLMISLPFFYWRFFVFESKRGATDIGGQFSVLVASPLGQAHIWIINLLQDMGSVFLGAWYLPLRYYYQLNKGSGWAISGLLSLIVLYFLYGLIKKRHKAEKNRWQYEAFFIGLLGIVFCQLPIILVNRQVAYPHFSRYALAGSLGATILLVASLSSIEIRLVKESIFLGLIFIASLTQFGSAQKFANETASMNNFWWQVSWRVPQFDQRTTLMANYPVVSAQEDYFIWGPANQIYYPAGTNDEKVIPGIYALILNEENIDKVMARERQEYVLRRGTETYPNARNILILSQPTPNSCVQMIDGLAPEYSPFEKQTVMRIGEFSEVEHIITDAAFHAPPEAVFGPEPDRAWCYFYQKATLARQTQNWDLVADLLAEASQKGFAPQDPVEWMPFIQASAMLADVDQFREIESQIRNDFVRQQACEILSGMEIPSEMRTLSEGSYCLSE